MVGQPEASELSLPESCELQLAALRLSRRRAQLELEKRNYRQRCLRRIFRQVAERHYPNARIHHATTFLQSMGLPTIAELAIAKSIAMKYAPP